MSVRTGQVGWYSLINAASLYEMAVLTDAFKDKVSRERHTGSLRLAAAARIAEALTTIDEVLATTPPIQ